MATFLVLNAQASGAAPVKDSGASLFQNQIQPVFARSCLACHSSQSKQGGLDLSTRDGILRGGGRGPAIIPGKAAESLLYKLIARQEQPPMPFKTEPLAKEVVDRIADWINAGASYGPDPGQALFSEHVKPILESQCLPCHGGGKTNRSGFDLSTREALLRGGDNGPAIVPGKPQESVLWKRITHELKPGMPYQREKLSNEAIDRIGAWIEAGAPYTDPLKVDPAAMTAIRATSDHWAFRIPERPAIPAVKNRTWVRNPIDAFIAARHEEKGLKPLPEADKRTLLRRVYLDLIGLPPSPEQMRALLADTRKDAYEKVVDELLASPRYAERWGRHWMDIWRYSDWYGRRDGDDQRNSARNIWHWRDWIIESLNLDKGYDQMIREMLAADELYPADPDRLRATGYLARNFYRFNRNVWMQDVVEHTSAAFLGLTMKCARCHDHKYDPISQEEYYRLRAFFEPYDVRVDRVPGQPDPDKDGIARVFEGEPREGTSQAPFIAPIYANTYRFIRGDENNPDKSKPLTPGVPEVLSQAELEMKPVALPVEAYNPDIRKFVGQDLIAQAKAKVTQASLPGAPTPRAERPAEAVTLTFDKDVKPIFEKNCIRCHSAKNDKSELSLETEESVLSGGAKNGPAIKPGKSADSVLIQYLRGTRKPRMPFNSAPLSEEQITTLAKWIDQLQEDPRVAQKKAEDAAALAEKELAWARAEVPAIEARVAADQAKYANPPDPNAEKLAHAAQKAEREANVLKAEGDLLKAQQQLADAQNFHGSEKLKAKKIASARKAVQAAAEVLGHAMDGYTPIAKPYPNTSSGRRTALANWIASKQNPLTARVAINHIWLRHFGKPLVPTVVNFGKNGKPPTDSALLDWLAVQFVESKWSMKAIHRLMVTSSTYRLQSSNADPKNPNLAIDAENRYYWRMNPRRMEAEIVRDSALFLAGQLDTTMSGPDIDESKADQIHRRSVYFRHTPDSQVQLLKLFDQPDPTDCYTRNESIIPQQALALSNSQFSYSQARVLARRISGESDADFIREAFEKILNQPPSDAEKGASEKFLHEGNALFTDHEHLTKFKSGSAPEVAPSADPRMRARENLVHALLNHTEFVTIR